MFWAISMSNTCQTRILPTFLKIPVHIRVQKFCLGQNCLKVIVNYVLPFGWYIFFLFGLYSASTVNTCLILSFVIRCLWVWRCSFSSNTPPQILYIRRHAILAFFNWSSNIDDDYSLVVKRDKYAAEEFNSAWRVLVTELNICCIGAFLVWDVCN